MKRILRLKLKLYLILTLTYLIIAVVSVGVFYFLTPQQYFAVYPSIDIFYWVCGMLLTFFLDRARAQGPDRLLNVFLLCRGIKLFLIIVFLIVGIRVIGMDKTTFAISLMCNYFVYSAMELYIYQLFTKKIMGK